ncbi:MAG: class I SAM-dependent methyltransferase, partial [Bacteroidia bacterium]
MKYQILSPENFTDYELLDCGDGRKLERFGKIKLIRPEPHATWKSQLSFDEWKSVASAQFISEDGQKGKWENYKDAPTTWRMGYKSSELRLSFILKLTSFKHVGLFPEQCVHWDYIHKASRQMRGAKVLNLFAYTGAASLAAKAAGADVIHLEGLKQLVSWSKQNMELNKLDNIRWLIEDALKFIKREVKRGNKYHGVIMDPPSFGIGPGGERFVLDDNLAQLIKNVGKVLEPKSFLVCNSYSFKFSALSLKNMFEAYLPKG